MASDASWLSGDAGSAIADAPTMWGDGRIPPRWCQKKWFDRLTTNGRRSCRSPRVGTDVPFALSPSASSGRGLSKGLFSPLRPAGEKLIHSPA